MQELKQKVQDTKKAHIEALQGLETTKQNYIEAQKALIEQQYPDYKIGNFVYREYSRIEKLRIEDFCVEGDVVIGFNALVMRINNYEGTTIRKITLEDIDNGLFQKHEIKIGRGNGD